ncbi:type III-B CRISPR module RAMP protein Cmr1 [Neisseria sp. HMSC064F04]|jgi:CRISPR-associated RAMP protein, cmr1 family|uniref:type III-B CRISPR module RAMP protein Cmr1 n=1 Tax=Neisseria mucosa TaxID=488 RepID=UPI0008A97064|nr:type III-B CRISPR module RAMP protein Cmr1 [Neisseria mucosa]OHR43636.1 type III-B CRISPR module RAMP protein Cmr1 [Neisseria sp. HMSC064F04]
MALLIPDFGPMEKLPESKEAWQEIYCELVTPLHGGGVVARESDEKLPVRVTAIRGQLRFWWRLLAQQKWNLSGKSLREAEFRLWGGIGEEAAASLVFLRVQIQNKLQEASLSDYAGPLGYALFTARATQTGLPEMKLGKEGLQWIVQWRLSEKANETDKQQVLETVRWWVNFGGVGARTRRGCGAFVVKDSSNPVFKQPLSVDEVMQAGCKLVLRPSTNHALAAWKEAVQRLRDFRQGKEVGRNPSSDIKKPAGRSRWSEPDEIRRITRTHSDRHKPEHPAGDLFARGVFGMPIIFHFVGGDEPADTTLQPKCKERMASPLIIRPVWDGKGGFQAAALSLPLDKVLNVSVELLEKKQNEGTVHPVTLWEESKARQVKPLSENGGGNPIDAFLNYFTK